MDFGGNLAYKQTASPSFSTENTRRRFAKEVGVGNPAEETSRTGREHWCQNPQQMSSSERESTAARIARTCFAMLFRLGGYLGSTCPC